MAVHCVSGTPPNARGSVQYVRQGFTLERQVGTEVPMSGAVRTSAQ